MQLEAKGNAQLNTRSATRNSQCKMCLLLLWSHFQSFPAARVGSPPYLAITVHRQRPLSKTLQQCSPQRLLPFVDSISVSGHMAPKGLPFSFHALETVESNTDVLVFAKAWVRKHNFQPSIIKYGNPKIAGVSASCQIASCKYHIGCDKKYRFSRRDARIFTELNGSC